MRTLVTLTCVATAGAFMAPVVMNRAPGVALSRAAVARPAPLPRLATMPMMAVDIKMEEAAEEPKDGLMDTLVTGSFFALWYLFNIGYNIYNKKALNALPIPYTMAALQLFVGIPYVGALWATGLRKAPKLSADNIKTLIPISLGHLGTHIGAVVSLGAGAVSFTHIIKASEPVVSAGLSALMLGAFYSPITYLTLVPIVGGVALVRPPRPVNTSLSRDHAQTYTLNYRAFDISFPFSPLDPLRVSTHRRRSRSCRSRGSVSSPRWSPTSPPPSAASSPRRRWAAASART